MAGTDTRFCRLRLGLVPLRNPIGKCEHDVEASGGSADQYSNYVWMPIDKRCHMRTHSWTVEARPT